MNMEANTKLIAIVGGSGSGKTWLAGRLNQELALPTAQLSLDDFYLEHADVEPAARAASSFDHPDSVDWRRFIRVLQACRAGRPTEVPRYDFVSHTRRPSPEMFSPAPLVLVEGLWLLWLPSVRRLFDFKLYLECPAQLRLERRLERDVKDRGRTPEDVRAQFWKTVAPMHQRFVAPQQRCADLTLQQPPDEPDLRRLIARLEALVAEPAPPVGLANARTADAVASNGVNDYEPN